MLEYMPEKDADADDEVDAPACESGISLKRTSAVDVDEEDDDAPAFLTAETSTGDRSTEESDPTNLESNSEPSSFSAKLIVMSSTLALKASATLDLSSDTLSLAWLFTTSSLLAEDDEEEEESEDSDIDTLLVGSE